MTSGNQKLYRTIHETQNKMFEIKTAVQKSDDSQSSRKFQEMQKIFHEK